jgi:hypothetical protein
MSRDERYRPTSMRSAAEPMSPTEQQPHRRRLVDLIRRIAVDGFGAEEVQRVAYPGATFTVAAVADGLSGLRAAAIAQSVARSQLYEYAAQARGAGRTWRDIAEALGLGVMSGEVGQPGDRWPASDGGVGAVVIVEVQPAGQGVIALAG